jgi:hypothetical protein
MRTPHLLALAVLALVPLFQGCVAAAAAGAGVVAGQVVLQDNTYISHLNTDSGRVWAQTKSTLSRKSAKPLEVDENHRRAVADLEGTYVTVTVETYDLNVSVLKVSAKKYGFPENDMAKVVLDRITEDINKSGQN